MANTLKLICTGRNVLYEGAATPQPATISIDTAGKIFEITPGYLTRDAHNFGIDQDGIIWIDAGDKIVLPGLVECVVLSTTKAA
jgi:allantoinase